MTPSAGSGGAIGSGGAPDRERLIESHLPLVRAIARRYEGRGETFEDLIQIGAVALIRASDRFDPERGVAFATFATPAVEGEIRRHLGERSGSVRIPRQLRQMTGALERSRAHLVASLGRAPTVDELASALGVERDDVERALQAGRARESGPAGADDVGETISDAESLQASDDRLLLAESAHVLDERERRIVFLRFHADMTEREIARDLEISQAQVSRLLSRALDKLRHELGDASGGDITKSPVISAEKSVSDPPTTPQTRRKISPSAPGETKIGGVGALEEQAHLAGAAPARDEDLALPYHVTVKPEGGDHGQAWIASLDELPGCEARGATPDQAVERLRAAMENWLSAAVEEPRVISPPKRASKRSKSSSHSGRFLVRMPSALHEELSRAAERQQVSLNRFVTAQLASAVAAGGSPAPAELPPPGGPPAPARRGERSLRMLLAANVLVIVLAAAAAIVLLVLALERGF